MDTSTTSTMQAAKQLAKRMSKLKPAQHGKTGCVFHLPPEDSSSRSGNAFTDSAAAFHAREMLVAAAHMLDPSIDLNSSALNSSLTFHASLQSFPSHQVVTQLERIQKDMAQAGIPTFRGINFGIAENAEIPLDYVLRAALPTPERFDLYYQLPEGQFRNHEGNAVNGQVSYETLLELIDIADRNYDHQAVTALHRSRCVGADISHEQAEKLAANLDISFYGLMR